MLKPLGECRLYTFVDTAYLHGRTPDTVAQQLCDGGSDIIQLRAKHSSLQDVRRMAETILPITRRSGIPLVINDHLSLARELGAACCHLGQEDFFADGVTQVSALNTRAISGTKVAIGISTHSPHQAARALAAGPDYVAIGPVYQTATKPTAQPVTLDYVRWAAANVTIPWFAIGGINLTTLDEVLAAGARRICVVSAILNSSEIATACHQFKRRLPK